MEESDGKLNMAAIILAGGRSSRMGRDKNLVEFDGEPLLLRAVNNLAALFSEVIVVANQPIPLEVTGAKVVRDAVANRGPLGGIGTGLKESSHETNFVLAVDMPFADPQVIRYLAGLTGKADIVVPRTAGGLEPLFAFYGKRCLPAIDEVLARGERKVAAIFPRLNVWIVGSSELAHLEGADVSFVNINTSHDLDKAEQGIAGLMAKNKKDDRRPPVERPVTIYIDDEELVTLQCSLEHLDELACGFMVAEGILASRDEIKGLRVDTCLGEARIELKKARPLASVTAGRRFVTSGCGKGLSFTDPGDTRGIGKLDSVFSVEAARIPELMKEFLSQSHRPGMHSSALVKDDKVWMLRQDIGRHNTVDMILGRLFLDDETDRDVMLLTTGRISYEVVVKAAKAGIPIILSRTAATDMAIDLAYELGVELVGYVRGQNSQVYTGGLRIRGK
ncbi:MAG: formate dehydrogenase accessory sulfurtransferase FdhD [Actinomycetota bacterium]|nr:formate dehydrogenase accessory sulfurtransferase FdhD [Actinomycetota bacterium]